MHGITRPGRTPTSHKNVYYVCPHNPANPRHAQAHPEHGRVSVKDDIIAAALARFADQYLLGHDRAAMLDIALPAGQAEEAERRDRKAEQLRARLDRIKTAQKGLMLQSEQLGDDTSPAANAYRDRIREQFTERYSEYAAVEAELDALTTGPAPVINDPTLLDELPYAPGLLAEAPTALRETLYAAFDIHCLYRHNAGQITIWATLTDTTPHIINALVTGPRTDDITPATTYADLQDAAIAAELHTFDGLDEVGPLRKPGHGPMRRAGPRHSRALAASGT
jgi:hypothetical protein